MCQSTSLFNDSGVGLTSVVICGENKPSKIFLLDMIATSDIKLDNKPPCGERLLRISLVLSFFLSGQYFITLSEAIEKLI